MNRSDTERRKIPALIVWNVLILFLLNAGTTFHLQGADTLKVFEPVIMADAPSNEATIVALRDGSYKVFYINRPGSADKLMSIGSEDGKEWSQPEIELNLPGEAYYANQVIQGESGSIHCVFHLWGKGDNGYRGRHLNLWYARKDPGTEDWDTPQLIYDGYVGSLRNLMQLRSGRLLLSFGKAVPERMSKPPEGQIDYGWNEVISLYSDNNGQDWYTSNSLNIEIDPERTTRYGAIEPDVLELNNGNLWMLMRTNKGYLYQTFSEDLGQSWAPPQPSPFISSDSPADFLRLKDGRIVLFFNMNQKWDELNSYAFGGREVLHGAISNDEGVSWSGFREVLNVTGKKDKDVNLRGDRGTAYPSAVETEKGEIILVTGQGASRYILMFHPDWLVQKNKLSVQSSSSDEVAPNSELVFNFPALDKGTVAFKLHPPKKAKSIQLSLTDHFSVSEDSLAVAHAVYHHTLKRKQLKADGLEVSLHWDLENGYSQLYISDQKVSRAKMQRGTKTGINYLRIGWEPRSENPISKPVFLLNEILVLWNKK